MPDPLALATERTGRRGHRGVSDEGAAVTARRSRFQAFPARRSADRGGCRRRVDRRRSRGVRPCPHGRFNIGACDWSIGMRARTDALALAQKLGLDGVQVSMGSVENDLHLRRPDVQQRVSRRGAGQRRARRRRRARRDESGRPTSPTLAPSNGSATASTSRARSTSASSCSRSSSKGDLRNDADGQAEVIRAAETGGAEGRKQRRHPRHRVLAERTRSSAHPRRGGLAGRPGLLRRRELHADGLRHRRRDPSARPRSDL